MLFAPSDPAPIGPHMAVRVHVPNLAFVVPPLAIIGFITPISGAGYLFPGAGWLGVAAAAFLPGLILSLGHPTSGAAHRPYQWP